MVKVSQYGTFQRHLSPVMNQERVLCGNRTLFVPILLLLWIAQNQIKNFDLMGVEVCYMLEFIEKTGKETFSCKYLYCLCVVTKQTIE